MTRGLSQLYLSLGDPNPDGSIAVRLYHKPLVLLIWLGALVMVFGGALSLSDRRLRVGAPKPRQGARPPCSRRSRPHALVCFLRACDCSRMLLARRRRSRCSPTRSCPIRRSKRARATLSRELRCMVCQNQSIDDFDAPLARDLRLLVRERLTAGDSDGQVIDYLVARYGEFVLLKPRVAWHTALLWAPPVMVLAIGVLILVGFARRRGRTGRGIRRTALSPGRAGAPRRDCPPRFVAAARLASLRGRLCAS